MTTEEKYESWCKVFFATKRKKRLIKKLKKRSVDLFVNARIKRAPGEAAPLTLWMLYRGESEYLRDLVYRENPFLSFFPQDHEKPQGIEAICPTCRMTFSEHERIIMGQRTGCRGYYFATDRKV